MKRLWKVRMYEEGDELGFIKLFNLVFPSKLNAKHWLWKYKNNPFGFIKTVAEYEGQIVGYMGLVPLDMRVGESSVRGAQAVDLAVHPRFRRQGMFLEIGKALMKEAAEEGIPIVYGVPNEPAYHGHMKYGWFYVGRIPVLIKFLSFGGLLRFLLVKSHYFILRRYAPVSGKENLRPFRFLKSLLWWMTSFPSIRKHKGVKTLSTKSFRIRQVSSFDGRVDDLWDDLAKVFTFSIVRKSRYLTWRYCEKPNADYKVFFAEQSTVPKGYVILSIERPWDWGKVSLGKLGYIVDILAVSKEVANQLIHAAIQYFYQQKVDLILCWMMKSHFLYRCLENNDFRYDKTLQEVTLISRINVPPSQFSIPQEEIKDEKNWFFTMGDSDLI